MAFAINIEDIYAYFHEFYHNRNPVGATKITTKLVTKLLTKMNEHI